MDSSANLPNQVAKEEGWRDCQEHDKDGVQGREQEDVVYEGQKLTKVYGARLCHDYAWKVPWPLNYLTAYNGTLIP